jgi:UDP-glucose 6-dehydrogenase
MLLHTKSHAGYILRPFYFFDFLSMRVLVTSISGFVRSHVIDRLIKEQHEMGVDDKASQSVVVKVGGSMAVFPFEPQFDIDSNPEFLREGSAIYGNLNSDCIVLGSNSS